MGLDSVLVVTDNLDDNLALASRNLPNVWCSKRSKLIRSRWFASPKC
jgi:ribosomal protein L4